MEATSEDPPSGRSLRLAPEHAGPFEANRGALAKGRRLRPAPKRGDLFEHLTAAVALEVLPRRQLPWRW
eukprot:11507197-Alexandrium_andersonii.AAC.1